ncbi:hypothetical protein V6R21_20075 [Limibacter armeniacum]|uniref:hypothetical protein n=1 Tax=Limibacter armeniacum TaxID=466084 RepID=UPI002FE6A5DC
MKDLTEKLNITDSQKKQLKDAYKFNKMGAGLSIRIKAIQGDHLSVGYCQTGEQRHTEQEIEYRISGLFQKIIPEYAISIEQEEEKEHLPTHLFFPASNGEHLIVRVHPPTFTAAVSIEVPDNDLYVDFEYKGRDYFLVIKEHEEAKDSKLRWALKRAAKYVVHRMENM